MTAMTANPPSPAESTPTAPAGVSASTTAATAMQAVVQDRYGSADVLRVRTVPRPDIGDDGILVRVKAVSLNAADWHLMRGAPFIARLGQGLRKPKQDVQRIDLAGVVESVGRDVTELEVGDEVFGTRSGALAEYVAGRLRNFARKPPGLSFAEAAALPVAAETALQALRNQGGLQPGQTVLIDGAGGGVGIYAVQIAKALGGRVTAATSSAKVDMVRSLGADEVIDYEHADPTTLGRRFDLVVDVGGYRSKRALRRIVTPNGTIVTVGAGSGRLLGLLAGMVDGTFRSRVLRQRLKFFLARANRDDLLFVRDLAASGKLRPVVERTYPLSDVAAAMRHLESGQVAGKLVITFGD